MKDFDKIEAFLANELPESELIAFQKELETDEELALAVQVHQFAQSSIDLAAENDLSDKIKAIRTDVLAEQQNATSQKARIRRLPSLLITMAASLLLLIGFFFLRPGGSNNMPIAQFYEFEGTTIQRISTKGSVRGVDDDNTIKFKESIDLLRSEQDSKIEIAIEKLESLQETKELSVEAIYLLGHAYYLKEDFSTALDYFNQVKVISEETVPYYIKDDATWYSLLTQLAMNDISLSFQDDLDMLVEINYKNAKKLKEKLR